MITQLQYESLAIILNVEVAAIKAVESVETSGRGPYLQDGRLRILFEAHRFWANLKRRGFRPEQYKSMYNNVLSPTWNKSLYMGGAKEWGRLLLACNIDKESAYKSASWGSFQIMGENYKLCGYKDVFEMVESFKASEYNNVLGFLRFVEATGLVKHLRRHDWESFARGYNGPGYKANRYDTKIAAAYKTFAGPK